MNRGKTREFTEDIIVPYPEVELAYNTDVITRKFTALIHKIDQLRNKDTPTSVFRDIVEEITLFEAIESSRKITLEEYELETPICKAIGHKIIEKRIIIAPIMRGGLGMEPSVRRVFPQAKTGHIGIYRDKITLEPVEYFWKMPQEIGKQDIFVLDPMLATGKTADEVITKLEEIGCKKIHFLCIIAAPQGVELIQTKHPDVDLCIGALDFGLDYKGRIVPGLGDVGDRMFGTD